MVHQLVRSLLTLTALSSAVSRVSSVKSAYNYTKRCFLEDDSEVIWNVTFTGDNSPNMNDPNVVMETKGSNYDNVWTSLTKCSRGWSWIQCEIERSALRHRYHMRIVKRSPEQPESLEYLVRDSPDSGHYQEGFLCHPNHALENKFIRNLTLSNITSDGVDVSWNFYRGDIDVAHLRRVRVYARDVKKTKGDAYTKMEFLIYGNTPLYFKRRLKGLLPCTLYNIQVEGHYDLEQQRVLDVPFTTMCVGARTQREKISMDVSVNEVVIVVISCVLLVVAVSLFTCFVAQRKRRRGHLQRISSSDVIDPRDLGLRRSGCV